MKDKYVRAFDIQFVSGSILTLYRGGSGLIDITRAFNGSANCLYIADREFNHPIIVNPANVLWVQEAK